MAAPTTKAPNGCFKQENVIERVFQLAVVSSTVDTLQDKYTNMKQLHPVLDSVCSFYEKGIQVAGSLAVWSIQPVVKKLEHHIIAANDIACKGIDHLEQKIPALQYPPEKIAFELKESISATIQHARSGICNPVTNSSDNILGRASVGFDLTMNTVNDAADYAFSTRISQMTSDAVHIALYNMEKLVDYFLPEHGEKPEDSDSQLNQSRSQSKSGPLPRIRALAHKVYQRTSHLTSRTIEDTKNKSQKLTAWIPALVPLAKEPQSLLVTVAQNLHHIYLSTITSMKKTPAAVWETAGGLMHLIPLKGLSIAKETLASLGGALVSFKVNALQGQTEEEEETMKISSKKSVKKTGLPSDSVKQEKSEHIRSKQCEQQASLEQQDPKQSALQKSVFNPYKENAQEVSVEQTYSRSVCGNVYPTTAKQD